MSASTSAVLIHQNPHWSDDVARATARSVGQSGFNDPIRVLLPCVHELRHGCYHVHGSQHAPYSQCSRRRSLTRAHHACPARLKARRHCRRQVPFQPAHGGVQADRCHGGPRGACHAANSSNQRGDVWRTRQAKRDSYCGPTRPRMVAGRQSLQLHRLSPLRPGAAGVSQRQGLLQSMASQGLWPSAMNFFIRRVMLSTPAPALPNFTMALRKVPSY